MGRRAIKASTIRKNWGQAPARLDDRLRAIVCHPDHLGYARALATIAGRGHSAAEDAVGAAYLGLCKAALAFDGALGVKFTTYARPHILGAIRDAREAEECRGFGLTVRERRAGLRPGLLRAGEHDLFPPSLHPWEAIDARLDGEAGATHDHDAA